MRKTKKVQITEEGRDKGKTFLITEMPAARAERWAMRALMAVADAGIDLPEAAAGAGMAGIAVLGIRAVFSIPFEKAEPLMNEMMTCVAFMWDARKDLTRPLVDDGSDEDDIEEVATRLSLRSEVLELHTGFSVAAAISESLTAATSSDQSGETTPTSPVASASRFRAV